MDIPLRARSITILFATCVFLALGYSAPALSDHCKGKHKKDPECGDTGGGGGGGGGGNSDPIYNVAVVEDTAMDCDHPLFNPGNLSPAILATTIEQKGPGVSYWARFPRHLSDGGPVLTLSDGSTLTDDIGVRVETNAAGQLVSVQVTGQPDIGSDALAHESEVVELMQTVDATTEPFTLHVDTDGIPMWQLSKHLGGKRVKIVGHFCMGDMVYTLAP